MQSDGHWTIPIWASAGSSLAMASCVKFHFDQLQRIHRKRSFTLFQQCNITFKKTGFKVSVVCPPVAWRCAEHFGRMWQCQHCRKVSQHRALGGLQSQNIRTEVDLFHQSINFQISHFRFSLQTLSHTESSHLPLFKNKYVYIYIYMIYASMLTYASSTVTSHSQWLVFELTFLELWGFKLFLVGHFGCLASIWIVIPHGGMDVPYGPLGTCTHVCTLNLWIHVNSNISKSKCCKIWQIRSCTTTVGNSVILIWLLLVPACIPILYHIPSPLTFTWGLGFPNGVPKPCGEDITNGGTGGIAFNLLKRSV